MHRNLVNYFCYAAMAELADALVLGSSVHDVQVQVLLAASFQKERIYES